jgi:DNA integrity scanning protein DisA with diadenylate cyclase activity
MSKHSHYFKEVSHLKQVDVYRVLDLFAVTNPCIQHATKKLLCAGNRGAKDYEKDLREAADSINRALQMIAEDRAGAIINLVVAEMAKDDEPLPLNRCAGCVKEDCPCLPQ